MYCLILIHNDIVSHELFNTYSETFKVFFHIHNTCTVFSICNLAKACFFHCVRSDSESRIVVYFCLHAFELLNCVYSAEC